MNAKFTKGDQDIFHRSQKRRTGKAGYSIPANGEQVLSFSKVLMNGGGGVVLSVGWSPKLSVDGSAMGRLEGEIVTVSVSKCTKLT
jgi:hypothetical protein